jgi:hypothetical protein
MVHRSDEVAMKFVDEDAEKRYNETKDKAKAAFDKIESLSAERKRRIHEAYLKLPNPDEFKGDIYRIPKYNTDMRVVGKCKIFKMNKKEYYEFVKINGKWAMTEPEMNRHVYEGLYI